MTMPSGLFLLQFHFVLLLLLLLLLTNRTIALDENPKLRLTIYPTSGYTVDNIDIRCEIFEPSIYDNVYLTVRTDNVKPSGILLMADPTGYDCRINDNKRKHIQIHICNSSMILINVNHEIINDSLHTIEYACSQGENIVFNSYRIAYKPIARYYDQKSTNSSLTLTYQFLLLLLLLFILTILR